MPAPVHHGETLERRTREIGGEIFDRSRALAPSIFSPTWWDEHIMQWSMGRRHLKGRLFRLVDVLPALPTRDAVARHLREYLGDAGGDDAWIKVIPPLLGAPGSMRGRLSAAAMLRAVCRLARRFVAGATPDEAADRLARLREDRLAFSLDLLGEKVLGHGEADAYAARYIELIDRLSDRAAAWEGDPLLDTADAGRAIPRVNLSIKLTSLDPQFDPIAPRRSAGAVLGRLMPILRRARGRGVFIHVDMEDYAVRDLTLDIFEQAATHADLADWRDLGIVVQAYLRDSERDLDRVAAIARRRGTPLTVRLVKGAYWDYENVLAEQESWPTPVFARKHHSDAHFERLTRKLLASDRLDPAIASHNVRSLAHAVATAQAADLPPGRVEYQLLYGMGDPIKAALAERGLRVRVYAPFGELIPGMAYLIRRLLENTANESFLRQGFVEHAEQARLLQDPASIEDDATNTNDPEPRTEVRRHVATKNDSAAPLPPFRNAPNARFFREANRMNQQQAIETVAAQLPVECRPIIAGRPRDTQNVAARENPADPAHTVARVHYADADLADAAVAAAEAAQPDWADRPAVERAEVLESLADQMERDRATLAALEMFECAKQWREADADVSEAIDFARFYAREAVRLLADDAARRRDVPGERNAYLYRPRGVGAVIAPWNFPLAIPAGMAAAAIAAGNAVVLKPAEQSSAVALRLAELADEAGLPPGVLNYLPGDGETVGQRLVEHPGVNFVAFTGSRQVGLAIHAKAAATPSRRGPKHVVCEMGGKNAVIVDADADLDDAVRGVLASAFGYNGQKCSACSRAIVLADAYDRFLERLVPAAEALTIGPATDPENAMGPLIDADALAKVRRYVELGKQEARCVLETDVSHLVGHYAGPTIFADVPPDARIAQEEIFGPVLAVIRAGDFDEALAIANGTDYALTGGLYSRSPANIERVRRELAVGNLYINRKITGALVDRQPFGGFRFSGLGSKAGGPDYLRQFLLPVTITENTLRHGFAGEGE